MDAPSKEQIWKSTAECPGAGGGSFSAASCCVSLGELLNLSDPPGEAGAEYSGVVLVSGKVDRYLGVAAIS